MNRRLSLRALVGLFAGILSKGLSNAADPAPKIARIGFVGPASVSTTPPAIARLWERLGQLGWVEGKNLLVERRWADGQSDRLPALFAELLALNVDILVTYTTVAGIAATRATSSVPIVDAAMGQPVLSGLAQSLGRPGGNLTGLSLGWGEGLGGKWLELLQESVSRLSTVAVVTADPELPITQVMIKELKTIAATRRLKIRVIEARDTSSFDRAFEQARRRAQAVIVISDPIAMAHREQITALAAKYRLPGLYGLREYVAVGGLMAYGPDLAGLFQRAAEYVDKILRGAKPADLPIEQPTQYSLILNLKAAKALGLTIPESILLRADEVIR